MAELPRFWFGQAVTVGWFNDTESRWIFDEGVIVGLAYKLPDCSTEEWQYAIEHTALNSSPWMPLGCIEWFSESDIRMRGTV